MAAVALLLPNHGPGTTAPDYLIAYQSLWQVEHVIRNDVVEKCRSGVHRERDEPDVDGAGLEDASISSFRFQLTT
jgi:hypothetical protein